MHAARDTVAAGMAGAAFSAVPSTAYSLIAGDDVLEGLRDAVQTLQAVAR